MTSVSIFDHGCVLYDSPLPMWGQRQNCDSVAWNYQMNKFFGLKVICEVKILDKPVRPLLTSEVKSKHDSFVHFGLRFSIWGQTYKSAHGH